MTLNQDQSVTERLGELEAMLPSSAANIRRLSVLLDSGEKPKVAVFGKYNHGKSTLLNAMIGQEVFKVADKRETISVSQFDHDDVTWIDTPGLDADVKGEDDRRAMTAALERADILCLVHNVKAGELDRSEMKLYRQLMRQDSNYRSKLVLVLTQIDQVTSDDLIKVVNTINAQLPDLKIVEVSAMRYIRGNRENKDGFIKASGMLEFQSYLNSLKLEISRLRKTEGKRLVQKARVELSELVKDRKQELASKTDDLEKHVQEFWSDVEGARKKILERAKKLDLV
ncbi:GTP-binding protein [Halomonas sp. TBZ9]|uniref:GTPase Era n=1 Tax=Vreelandella azerica TaxID=2732867 RepID=A0A7Y3TVC4_9GAMM|nr:GTPase [Halomonas azerica]NOG30573.1 GTP-binding protein [Halomonas azerica]